MLKTLGLYHLVWSRPRGYTRCYLNSLNKWFVNCFCLVLLLQFLIQEALIIALLISRLVNCNLCFRHFICGLIAFRRYTTQSFLFFFSFFLLNHLFCSLGCSGNCCSSEAQEKWDQDQGGEVSLFIIMLALPFLDSICESCGCYLALFQRR